MILYAHCQRSFHQTMQEKEMWWFASFYWLTKSYSLTSHTVTVRSCLPLSHCALPFLLSTGWGRCKPSLLEKKENLCSHLISSTAVFRFVKGVFHDKQKQLWSQLIHTNLLIHSPICILYFYLFTYKWNKVIFSLVKYMFLDLMLKVNLLLWGSAVQKGVRNIQINITVLCVWKLDFYLKGKNME